MKAFQSAATLMLLLVNAWAQAAGLNDTGLRPDQYACTNNNGLYSNGFSNSFGDIALRQCPGQDPEFGRDPAADAGVLVKVGAGPAGFDFTRICGNGDEEGQGSCPAGLTSANIGDGPTQWACTRDNLTGRTWEVKTNDGGLRDNHWKYSWYDSDADTNGGDAGLQTPSTGNPTICGSNLTNCNTEEYAAALDALNAGTGLCGFTDWRLPGRLELVDSILDFGSASLKVDADYFPNTLYSSDGELFYWSGNTDVNDQVDVLLFTSNFLQSEPYSKQSTVSVRLVRGKPLIVPTASPSATADCTSENTAVPFSTPTSDFTLNPDGTATHHETGLIWDRCAYGQTGADCSGGSPFVLTWQSALKNAEAANTNMYKGHNDWRVPNIKELISIREQRCSPAINTTVFPNPPSELPNPATYGFVSSTISIYNSQASGVFVVYSNGVLYPEDRLNAGWWVRLVRGGQLWDTFDAQYPTWLLSVKHAGTGSGTVTDTSGPCVLDSDGNCLVAPGSDVTLHAQPDPGSLFTGWSDASGSVPTDCNDTLTDCSVSAIAANGSATANFVSDIVFKDGFE